MSKMIALTEDGYMISSDDIHAGEYINMTLSAQMQMFNAILNSVEDEEERTKVKEEMYDIYNQAASSFLAAFAPELELRPDLTAEAILKAENEILDAQSIE